MASSEKSSSRPSRGWLPKLVLWSAVIAFGYVYLSSVDREDGSTSAGALLESIAKLSPVPLSSIPGLSKFVEPAGEEAGEVAAKTEEEAPKAVAPKPVSEAESAVFAKSLIKEKEEAVEAVKPTPTHAPATYTAAATQKPVVEAAPAPAVATPSQPAVSQTTPATPRAESQVATAMPPQSPAPSPSAAAVEPGPSAPMPSDWESMEDQRSQMVARYEEMRREADARMRQYWERMRESAPMVGPYGYPAYGPGYAPGYAPSR